MRAPKSWSSSFWTIAAAWPQSGSSRLPVPADAQPVLVSVSQFGSVRVAVRDSAFDMAIPVDNVGTSGLLTSRSADGTDQAVARESGAFLQRSLSCRT